jgi:hypothetical protein
VSRISYLALSGLNLGEEDRLRDMVVVQSGFDADEGLLRRNWEFQNSNPSRVLTIKRMYYLFRHGRAFPRAHVLKSVRQYERWICYFIFSPTGQLTPAHRFTLSAIKNYNTKIMVVIATNGIDNVSPELSDCADAILWKQLIGYDFSAYTLGLDLIGRFSPGADVLVFNDSVYGPFFKLERFFETAKWDLTGFTAGYGFENHIQSYAFILKNVTQLRLANLSNVFSQRVCFNDCYQVVICQETRLARVASKYMSVGAFWAGSNLQISDPPKQVPELLIEEGFPFMKRSLFEKHRGVADIEAIQNILVRRGHPKVE